MRSAGASPGVLDPFSPRETEDYATLITWGAHQASCKSDWRTFEATRRVNALLRDGGLERYKLTSAEVRAIEPSLRMACHAEFYTPSDSTGDIDRFTHGLADACGRSGAQFVMVMERNVTRIVRHRGQFLLTNGEVNGSDADEPTLDGLVVAAGVGSRRIGAMLGDRVNAYPVKGYSINSRNARSCKCSQGNMIVFMAQLPPER